MNKHEDQSGMSDKTFTRFAAYIQRELGIRMPDEKKMVLQSRLLKRLKAVGITTFEHYYDFVFSPAGLQQELHHLLDAATTNKTDFFREPKHFDMLLNHVLPDLIHNHGAGTDRSLKIWSAGCANGKEVYTLSMLLTDYTRKQPKFDFSIIGTDISTKALAQAKSGVYQLDDAEPIPLEYRKKFLYKSKDPSQRLIRMGPEIRSRVLFGRMNLMNPRYRFRNQMDIIFCRNVFIYFDRPTQIAVLNRLCQQLRPGGYLFSGHSEGINGFHEDLIQMTHAVFKKKELTNSGKH